MNTDSVETRLGAAFAHPLSPAQREVLDSRVASAFERPALGRPRYRWALAIGLAGALVAGTVVASGGLFEALTGGAPALEKAWAEADVLGLSSSDQGVTIMLERAGIGADRLWVAVSLSADSGESTDFGAMQVTDANGTTLVGGTGVGSGDTAAPAGATVFGFSIPDGVSLEGPFALEISSVIAGDEITSGSWSFSFDLASD